MADILSLFRGGKDTKPKTRTGGNSGSTIQPPQPADLMPKNHHVIKTGVSTLVIDVPAPAPAYVRTEATTYFAISGVTGGTSAIPTNRFYKPNAPSQHPNDGSTIPPDTVGKHFFVVFGSLTVPNARPIPAATFFLNPAAPTVNQGTSVESTRLYEMFKRGRD